MTKQTAQEWLLNELEKKGYAIVEPIFTDVGFNLYTAYSEKVEVNIYSQDIKFNRGDDGEFYEYNFGELKYLLEIAEQYKEMTE